MLEKLLTSYFTDGWFFCLMHVLLTVAVIPALVDFAKWNPTDGSARAPWESLEMRSQFIRGLIGLYLLIGIAGTFFGLFEFAVKAQIDDASIRTALTSAVAKAFPVGFVGLIAGLTFHVVIDFLERRKMKVLETMENNESVDMRELVRTGFESTDRAIGTQTAKLGAGLAMMASGIEAAMKPIEKLEDTLGKTLEPVVRSLGKSLRDATGVLKEQGDRLEAGKNALLEASRLLAESAKQVETSFAEIGGITEQARSALEQAKALSEQSGLLHDKSLHSVDEFSREASGALKEAEALFSIARKELEEAGIGLRQVPDQLENRLADQAQTFAALTTGQFRNDLEQLYVDAGSHLVEAFNRVGALLNEHNAKVEAIARDVDTVTTNFENTQAQLVKAIDDGIGRQSDEYGNRIQSHVNRVFGPFEAADKGVAEFQAVLSRFATGLSKLETENRSIVEAHAEALARLDRMSAELSSVPSAAKNQRERLESLVAECRDLLAKLPRPAAPTLMTGVQERAETLQSTVPAFRPSPARIQNQSDDFPPVVKPSVQEPARSWWAKFWPWPRR